MNQRVSPALAFAVLMIPALWACDFSSKPIPLPDGDADIQEETDGIDDPVVEDTPPETDLPPGCGNGVVEGDEECDDGNDVTGDGCEADCTFSCRDYTDCADEEICNGFETCDPETHACVHADALDDGTVCRESPRNICLAGVCSASVCGDGFVDTGGGESCEPPAAGSCNDQCRLTCASAGDCPDDGNVCNGDEYCAPEGLCASQAGLPNGTLCSVEPRKICIAETCQQSLCGDGFTDYVESEECDDGNRFEGDGCDNDCTYTCRNDPDCDDGLPCTSDYCDTSRHLCDSEIAERGMLCRPVAGDCDVEETCDGERPTCPVDVFILGTVECRASADQCDAAEFCTGSAPECPEDGFADEGTECDDGNECTTGDVCNGSGECGGSSAGSLSGVTKICSGGNHVCALLEAGMVACWGANGSGQLGDGTTSNRTSPVFVSGLSANAVTIACGFDATCAVLAGGGVVCWGDNGDGQLGIPVATASSATPVSVTDLASDALALIGGDYHFCAIMVGGEMRCWGRNDNGQLGNGLTTDSHVPVSVGGLASTVTGGAAGRNHTCALLSTGAGMCWGDNDNGQLGTGDLNPRLSPVTVSGLESGVLRMAAGRFHTGAVMASSVKCWGHNSYGQVGDGTTLDQSSPVDVTGLTTLSHMAMGSYHTCGTTAAGTAKCWGRNNDYQLGNGLTATSPVPVDVLSLASAASMIAAGLSHTCALLDSGQVQCWGNNDSGQLGDGSTTERTAPVTVVCR